MRHDPPIVATNATILVSLAFTSVIKRLSRS
jgi:hypothetical protein